VAKVASDAEKPAGFVVLTREQACARFAARRPSSSRGSAPRPRRSSPRWASRRSARLAATDEAELARRFGSNQGPWLRRRAQFHGSEHVESVRVAVSESRERTFDTDISDLPELEGILRRLRRELCEGLAQHGRTGRTIAIKVRLDDWTTVTRARTLPDPTNDAERVGELAVALLREYEPARPVRLLGVRVASFAPDGDAPPAGATAVPAREAAGQLALEV
jgi:DNA polymerase-4